MRRLSAQRRTEKVTGGERAAAAIEAAPSAGAGDPCIYLRHVGLTYRGSGQPVEALRDVTLEVAEGEFLALLGPTGCGKSTLLRLVADLLRPTVGEIGVRGDSPNDARRKHEFGFIFQEPALLPWRSALKNVLLPLESVGYAEASSKDRARELLALVGLEQFTDLYPHELSGGMKQRVAIARALAFDPPILLMDEPFSALDELTRERLQEDLLRIWAVNRKTILFVTHNIGEAVYLADRVAVFSGRPGKIRGVVDVSLGRPRAGEMRDTIEFVEHVRSARGLLRPEDVEAGEREAS